MSEQVFEPWIDDVVVRRVLPPEMIRDLHTLAELSEDTCGCIAEALRELRGLNTSDAISDAIRSCLRDEDAGKEESVLTALRNLKPSAVPRLLGSIKGWVAANDSVKRWFPDSLLEQLARNLPVLISDFPAVALMQKADQLVRDVGNELENVKFVCDLRPVFDKPRTSVEGFVLIANMRLIYLSQDGNRHTCEIAMTEDELQELWNNADKALKKLTVLSEVCATLNAATNAQEESQ